MGVAHDAEIAGDIFIDRSGPIRPFNLPVLRVHCILNTKIRRPALFQIHQKEFLAKIRKRKKEKGKGNTMAVTSAPVWRTRLFVLSSYLVALASFFTIQEILLGFIPVWVHLRIGPIEAQPWLFILGSIALTHRFVRVRRP